MAATYHVAFVNPATGANQTTVDVSAPDNPQVQNYLKSMHGKLGFEYGFPSIASSSTQATSLDSVATAARRYAQMVMFITWDG